MCVEDQKRLRVSVKSPLFLSSLNGELS